MCHNTVSKTRDHSMPPFHKVIGILNNNIASCAIWMLNMVSYIKEGMLARGISKQDPEANIWAQEG